MSSSIGNGPAEVNSSDGKKRGDKIYRGGYLYLKNNNPYSEEAFDVYKDKKEMSLNFVSEIHSRVTTGEMLSAYVDYLVTKDFNPISLTVTRRLGQDVAREVYLHQQGKNIVQYSFYKRNPEIKEGTDEEKLMLDHTMELTAPPRFHLTTPGSSTGMLFIKSKKSTSSGKNFFTALTSENQWTFETAPVFKSITTERVGLSSETLNIEGHALQAIQYKIYEDDPERSNKQSALNAIRVWMSQHAGIPYMIRTQDGIKIHIKYLNIFEVDAEL